MFRRVLYLKTLRFLFGFSESVSRRQYVVAGLSLALLKYALDFTAVYVTTKELWSPLVFLSPLLTVRVEAAGQMAPAALLWVMAAYSLPFAWIGLSMSVRRAADAGRSPWLGVLFLLPVINLLMILGLSLSPTRGQWRHQTGEIVPLDLRNAALGIVPGLLLALVMVVLSVFVLGSYGWTLFFATPFAVGVVAGFLTNRTSMRRVSATVFTSSVTMVLIGMTLVLLALEGIVCVLMAAPLAIVLAMMGGLVGRAMANARRYHRSNPAAISVILLSLPLFAAAETFSTDSPVYEVASSVVVDADAMVVWEKVLSFSELPEPSPWVKRTGVAYPTRAELVGEGVGAVRYCEFSTGPFVEPITVWEPGRRLAFDVESQPAPMKEWSPYRHVHPPHLDGYLRSLRGEFRLVDLGDGRTRLEGSTWYEIDMSPRAYWSLYSSAIIQSIHMRVLHHVKAEAEEAARQHARGQEFHPGYEHL